MRRVLGLGLLLGLTLSALPAQAKPDDHAIIVQESNGFPGGEKSGALVKQFVTITGGRLQVLDRRHKWALQVDLDRKTVHELDAVAREYVRRSFAFYKKYRVKRQRSLQDQAKEFKRKLKRLGDDREKVRRWKNEYRKGGGDPEDPGKIVARLQHYPGDKTKSSIQVDGKKREITLEHYVIRENQANRPVFDLWITRDVTLPVDVFRFYRELGTFSPEVSAKLQEVKGTIIRCVAVLDTGSVHKIYRSRVLEVRTKERPFLPAFPPKGFKARPLKAAVPKKPEVARACGLSSCNNKIAGSGHRFREPWPPRRMHVACSSDHRKKMVKELIKRRKKGG